jgi:ABC-type sulfate/molybdate transport systems ATPase subunit
MHPSFVEVRRLSAGYSVKATGVAGWFGTRVAQPSVLHDVTFGLDQGQHYTLFGTSASGKTTLLRVLAGLVVPRSGHVLVNKTPPPATQAGLGLVTTSEPPGSAMASTTQDLHAQLRRAAASAAPLILLDDVADQLGVPELQRLASSLFRNRTVLLTTRHAATAQALNNPLLVLQHGRITHTGTNEAIAKKAAAPRLLDIWLEGMRYDIVRALKNHSGVLETRLFSSPDFNGHRLRLTVRSSHYLPSVYDVVSQLPLIRVEEIPPSLAEVLQLIAQVTPDTDPAADRR